MDPLSTWWNAMKSPHLHVVITAHTNDLPGQCWATSIPQVSGFSWLHTNGQREMLEIVLQIPKNLLKFSGIILVTVNWHRNLAVQFFGRPSFESTLLRWIFGHSPGQALGIRAIRLSAATSLLGSAPWLFQVENNSSRPSKNVKIATF